jgi:hypothetical protein
MKARRAFVVQLGGNFIKRLGRAGGLGKGHRDGFRAVFFGAEQVNTSWFSHAEKSFLLGFITLNLSQKGINTAKFLLIPELFDEFQDHFSP